MKVLIIGSKGFIGSNLTDYLHGIDHEVWGADITSDGEYKQNFFLLNATNTDFSIVFRDIEYDVCINCSGAASVPESLVNPIRDYFLNAVNVYKILNAIRIFQSECKFINLSSAAVYGNPKHLPVSESASLNPLSPYGVHKLQSEQLCKEFYDFYCIKTCSIRIFSVYGAGLRKQLFWDLYKKAKSNLPFTLFGTGEESRDFINVLDLVKAIDLVMESSDFKADVINIANGEEIMIKDAVSIFFSFFNHKVEYSFSCDTRKGDPLNWLADINKLRSFGYKPSIDIKDGLQKYFKWLTLSRSL